MQNDLMTLKDIAQKLGLPESTLRKYRDAYPQHIPTVGTGRERLYKPRAVQIFETIRRCRAEDLLSWQDTGAIIAEKFPPGEEEPAAPARESQTAPPVPPQTAAPEILSAVAALQAESKRQSFLLNTICAELIKTSQSPASLQEALKDIVLIRRTVFAQNNDFRSFEHNRKAERDEIAAQIAGLSSISSQIKDAVNSSLAELASGIAEMQQRVEKETKAAVASAPAADMRRLTALLKERNDEIGRLKALNSKLITENETYKTRLAEAAAIRPASPQAPADQQQPYKPQHEPLAEHSIPQTDRFMGGKFVFKGKKR